MKKLLLVIVTSVLCSLTPPAFAETYTAEVWADNWFQFRVNGVTVAQDSVPITAERSFNAERFSFESSTPFTIGLIAMDFKENNTGLEYIGTRKQQMGDGGVIAQITDSQGNVIAVTDAEWRCLVIHEAPLSKGCEKTSNPVAGEGQCGFSEQSPLGGWDTAEFDDSNWSKASVYSEGAVRPKDGYDRINWDKGAELIWGPDLETNNTLLCRVTVK